MTDLLQQLMSRCKCGIHITINAHRDYYETVEQHISPQLKQGHEIDAVVYSKMQETNTIVEVQAYPRTPIGFILVWHHDLTSALLDAIQTINRQFPESGTRHEEQT